MSSNKHLGLCLLSRPRRTSEASHSRPKASAELVTKHPFLTRLLQADKASSSADPEGPASDSDEALVGGGPLPDQQVEEVFQALEEKRQEWDQGVQGYDGDFKVALLGGLGS